MKMRRKTLQQTCGTEIAGPKPVYRRQVLVLIAFWLTGLIGLPLATHHYASSSGSAVHQSLVSGKVREEQRPPDSSKPVAVAGKQAREFSNAPTNISEPNLQNNSRSRSAKSIVLSSESAANPGLEIARGYEISRHSPVEALTLLAGQPPSIQRDDAIAYAVCQWAVTDGQAAIEWASNVANPELRSKLIANAATSFAEVDPARAAEVAVTKIEDPGEQARTVVEVAQRWAQNDRDTALQWVANFPQGIVKDAALEAIEAEGSGDLTD